VLYVVAAFSILLLLFALYAHRNKKRLERISEELATAKANADYANQSKSLFLTNMSHELRTPLNAILGFSQLLMKEQDIPSRHRGTLSIIQRSGNFLLSLINEVLDLSRIEAGKITIETEPVDLHLLSNDLIALLEERAASKGLEIVLDLDPSTPRCVLGDSDKIRQILLNFLANAIKYSDSGRIVLKLWAKDATLFLEVRDQGIGIAAEDLEQIFEPFVQVGPASEKTGTGLGLSIAKRFAEAMGGSVEVESTLGEGSIFRLVLPYTPCEPGQELPWDTGSHKQVLGLADPHRLVKVLVVEDKEDNRLLLRNLLSLPGFEIREAVNGKEAVDIFAEWQPDFIWMDRRMPVMDGEEATRAIRAMPGGDQVVIVALTASAFSDEKGKILEAGMDDFVIKPYYTETIFHVLKKHLGLEYRYQDTPEEEKEASTKLSEDELVQRLRSIDSGLRSELRDRAQLLNREDMTEVIDKVRTQDDTLAGMLEQLVANLEFHKIIKAVDSLGKV